MWLQWFWSEHSADSKWRIGTWLDETLLLHAQVLDEGSSIMLMELFTPITALKALQYSDIYPGEPLQIDVVVGPPEPVARAVI